MIRAVIFDLGGTLLEYKLPGTNWTQFEQAGAKAAWAYLVEQGHTLPDCDAFVTHTVEEVQSRWQQVTDQGGNFRLADLLCDVCARYGLVLAPEEIEAVTHAYVTPLSLQARSLPGVKETLQALQVQDLRIGLISNTMWPGHYHLGDLARHGLVDYFHHTLFSADFGIWKPHPGIFCHSLTALEVAPDEAAFVGDFLPHDIAGAQSVGMKGIHITTGEFSSDGVEPDGRIDALAELPALIALWQDKPKASSGRGVC